MRRLTDGGVTTASEDTSTEVSTLSVEFHWTNGGDDSNY
jgi:hypothetical protein